MHKNSLQKLILSEIQEVKTDMKEVRQKDIPDIHSSIATLKAEITHVKEKTAAKSTIITAIGGILAVLTSMALGFFK